MNQHWDEARELFEVLLFKCRKIDDDGVDVMFTCTDLEKPLNSDKVDIMSALYSGHYDPHRKTSGRINIQHTLEMIFEDFLSIKTQGRGGFANFFRSKKQAKEAEQTKAATLVFLTDGIWAGLDREKIEQTIKDFLQKLSEKYGNLDKRPFTIQFIHFGEDQIATRHLDRMDDNLCSGGLLDVIDTEPARGDIYKMLLGSLKPEYDDLDKGLVQTTEKDEKEEEAVIETHNVLKTTTSESLTFGDPQPEARPAHRGFFQKISMRRKPSISSTIKNTRRTSSRTIPNVKTDLSTVSEEHSVDQATAGASQHVQPTLTADKISFIVTRDTEAEVGASRAPAIEEEVSQSTDSTVSRRRSSPH
jgi:hypothetical protein